MASFLAIAVGLAFTLVVCLLVLRALLEPWLHFRHTPAAPTHDSPYQHASYQSTSRATRPRGTQPLHIA